jgi:predicted TIM-barrel fold metal-dependent hydrolase
VVLGRAGASSVVRRDGSKSRGVEFIGWRFDDAHLGAHEVDARLALMDELGIWAQIVYPNAVGFGGQRFGDVTDPELRLLCATLYNDAMAEVQEASAGRLFPMALVPWWDVDAAVAEIERIHRLGLRGVNTNSGPQDQGLPDLGERHWDPLWEICADLGLPVNFHIGASQGSMTWFGSTPWPSQGDDQKLAIGSAMMYLSNAAVLANIIVSGVLERFPTLQVVSVESGIGWIPFFLQALDHQITETVPGAVEYLSMPPSGYFRRQVHGCFWFEQHGLAEALAALGDRHVMFETDFPHPTCLYPDSLTAAAPALAQLDPDARAKVLSTNAIDLYHLPIDVPAAARG